MSQQKFECGKMFKNDVLNNILKPPLPPPGAFFYRGFNTLNNLKMEWGFAHHATIGVIFTFFFGKTAIILSIFSGSQK